MYNNNGVPQQVLLNGTVKKSLEIKIIEAFIFYIDI